MIDRWKGRDRWVCKGEIDDGEVEGKGEEEGRMEGSRKHNRMKKNKKCQHEESK